MIDPHFVCSRCNFECKTSGGLARHINSQKCVTQAAENILQARAVALPANSQPAVVRLSSSHQLFFRKPDEKLMKRVSKSVRMLVADCLASTLEKCAEKNSVSSWSRVFAFSSTGLRYRPARTIARNLALPLYVRTLRRLIKCVVVSLR